MTYDEIYKNTPDVFGEKPSDVVNELIKYLPLNPRVLEIGAGTGTNIIELLTNTTNSSATVIEPSKVACDLIKKRTKSNGVFNRLRVINSSAGIETTLSVDCNCFLAINVLHHLKQEDSLEILYGIINKFSSDGGGIICLQFFIEKMQGNPEENFVPSADFIDKFLTSNTNIEVLYKKTSQRNLINGNSVKVMQLILNIKSFKVK